MGFSGGGSNITKAHTHDSTVIQDGGALAANVTQFGLTAGSILYSDGSNIQELGVGSAADVLTVNGGATAPEWAVAGGGGGGAFTELFSQVAGTSIDVGGTGDTTFDDYNFIYVSYLFQNYRAGGTQDAETSILLYDNSKTIGSAANYQWAGVEFDGTVISGSSGQLNIVEGIATESQGFQTGYFQFTTKAINSSYIYGYAQASKQDVTGTDPAGGATNFLCNNVDTSIRGFYFNDPSTMGTNTVTYKVWGI